MKAKMNLSRLKLKRRLLVLLFSLAIIALFCLNTRETNYIENGALSTKSDDAEISKNTHIILGQRKNMAACPQIFGKVTIIVVGATRSLKNFYRIAQDSLHCYHKSTNYTLRVIDLDTDCRVFAECKHHLQLFFKKHCATAAYLRDTDWMLVLDADTAIVNPNHCIEEWIDPRVDLIFYERFFNWEIASGNYLAKNTQFAYDFLKRWAGWEFRMQYYPEFNGWDNGALHMVILQTVMPLAVVDTMICDAIWKNGSNYGTYMSFVTCVKLALGAKRIWPGQVRIYRRAHAWVRDGHLTDHYWCDLDFMLHDYKHNKLNTTPFFVKDFDQSECRNKLTGWHWRKEKHVNETTIKTLLRKKEVFYAKIFPQRGRLFPWLFISDVGYCWPHCDIFDVENYKFVEVGFPTAPRNCTAT